jgi:subtilisin
MRLKLAIISLLTLAACSKKDIQHQQTEPEVCAVGTAREDGSIIEGQYIVSLRSASVETASSAGNMKAAINKILGRNRIESSSVENSFAGNGGGFVAELSRSEAEILKNDPSVKNIEPDRIIALSTCFQIAEPKTMTWNIEKVGYGDGRGKTAWVIDSGIDFEHPDLTVDVNRSRSFVSGSTTADDENGHGTHVAGIIGAKNNSFGVVGVASGANLVALKVLDKDGKGSLSSVIQALTYINQNAKAGDVVNISLGDDKLSDILDQQVKYTASLGIYVSIAAGNDSKPASQFSPARVNAPNVYTVSAVDSLNNFASFSNYGNDAVDFAAPGIRILSTYTDGRYAKLSGTSMAAPHLSGLLLLKGSKISYSGLALNDPDGEGDKIVHK